MLFNSIPFLIFFPIVTIGYFLLPHRARWLWLLGASCYFYMAFIPAYILILVITILIDYVAAILIEDGPVHRRKVLLVASITSTCLVLAIFKYLGFLTANAAALARLFHMHTVPPAISLVLPIGLSFHTFQSLSYVIEVYRGNQRAERHFGIYSLYVMFYPQLVAGPIERPQNLLHQFHEEHRFDYARVVEGLQLMAWGMVKKVVVADRLSTMVNPVYENPSQYSGSALALATLFFSYQIYCDFSGYSDVAIGAARVMGFQLSRNFDRPYSATSIAEFWRRWHISLSTWFRDYVYIPLGGNRVGSGRRYLNLMVTFLVSGLWHGANWTFVLWGALHGVYMMAGQLSARLQQRMAGLIGLNTHPTVRRVINRVTVLGLVAVAWILFRANSLVDAYYVFTHLTARAGERLPGPSSRVVWGVVLIAALEFAEWRQGGRTIPQAIAARPSWQRWVIYFGLPYSVVFLGAFGDHQFIYFTF